MKTMTRFLTVLAVVGFLSVNASMEGMTKTTQLIGKTDFSIDDASGWLVLPATDFASGDHLVITVGGTASAVVVRLLPVGFDPRRPDVIVQDRAVVRSDRTVDVALTSDFKNIVQISIHGGANPWGAFPLGGGNGRATLVKVERYHK